MLHIAGNAHIGFQRAVAKARRTLSRLFVTDFGGWDLLVFLFMAPFSRCLEYERCNSAARTRASAFCMPQTGHLVIFGG